jgi:hypothetical protein
MKKASFFLLICLLLAGLSGCAAQTTPTGGPGAAGTGEAVSGLSTLNKMAVGVFKLDGSANDLSAEQAQQMLVLWQAYVQLTDSDTTATQEKEAVVSQIQSTLTSEQLAAIEALNLRARDVNDLMQEKGLSANASTDKTTTTSSTSNRGGMGGGPGGGGMPGGGMPGGGMADGGMGGQMPGANATPGADGQMPAGGPGGGGYVDEASTQAIIEALIKMLQQKAAA